MNQQHVIIMLSDSAPSSLLKNHYSIDRKFRKLWLERREDNYQYIPIEFSHDKNFLLKFIRRENCGRDFPKAISIFEQIPPSLQQDEDIFVEFFVSFCKQGKKLQDRLTEEMVVKLAKRYQFSDIIKIGSVKKELVKWINCRNVLLECVRNGDSEILSHVSQQLRKDRELMMEAVKNEPLSIKFADKSLQNDRELVFEAVKRNGRALEYTFSFRNDREIVITAVNTHPEILKYVNSNLQNDFELVMEAIKSQGSCIQYASTTLKKDRNIVMKSVTRYGAALQYLDDSLRNDREIVLQAVNQNGAALKYASNELKNDRELVMIAIQKNPEAYEFCSTELKHDKTLALLAISKNRFLTSLIPLSLQKDTEIQQHLYQSSPPNSNISSLYDPQRNIRMDGTNLGYLLNGQNRKNNLLLQIEAVKSNGFYVQYSKELFDIRMKEAYQNITLGNRVQYP
ncbi:predicted protein [Naegleria gruberi]|uniref:Predicted protein n=1 Tax=Naegleria gruberi TaxID=5762 RepID=D2VZC7_NAEGR|nr:uncharacterized protein NAEGRDRAFT_74444 [Naegleria gruberi]EFC37824.1 predicted protein [Naegleria gruberi]|eukprot:XP_002670568.1 predicted protein [Naegleria gruberi strain NEG-M]